MFFPVLSLTFLLKLVSCDIIKYTSILLHYYSTAKCQRNIRGGALN